MSNFDEAYANKPVNAEKIPCKAPECFVGEMGPFFVNT
jgi:hypothetical protein